MLRERSLLRVQPDTRGLRSERFITEIERSGSDARQSRVLRAQEWPSGNRTESKQLGTK